MGNILIIQFFFANACNDCSFGLIINLPLKNHFIQTSGFSNGIQNYEYLSSQLKRFLKEYAGCSAIRVAICPLLKLH